MKTAMARHLRVDVQTTLTELTARACADALRRNMPGCESLAVCGGGAYNRLLMQRIQMLLPGCQVQSSDELGLPPLQVEATAFAWLARQAILRHTASLPKRYGRQRRPHTGSNLPRLIHPARRDGASG